MLFGTIVIEYLSNKTKLYGDYRDIVPHFYKTKDLIEYIDKLYNDTDFRKKIIKFQSEYIDNEIKKPPRTKEILDFIKEV